MKKDSVAGMINSYAESCPQKTALIVEDRRISYHELNEGIKAAASFLEKQGVGRGSHVISEARPCFEYVACMYAVLGLGAVHIPVENRIPPERVAEIAEKVDADYVISCAATEGGYKWINTQDIDFGSSDIQWDPEPVSDECSEIVFTTGTTGKSKGVMLSSHCLDVYLDTMNRSFRLDENSVFLLTTPLNHVGGMHRIHQCMAVGSTIIMMEGVRDLKAFFRNIDTYGVTHTYLPPASVKILITLAKKELARLDGKIKFIYTASAPFPVSDIEKLMSLMPHTHLHQGYGSSETGSICNCCYNAPGESPDCLGKPYPCVEVILHDADGNVIDKPFQEGKIRSRSGMNMLGYYREPELTAATLRDGFIYSNDLMFFDDKGNLHFAGRGDDVINVKGFKIAPVEIENCAMQHPAIFDCLCIPYEEASYGRCVKMLVRLREGESLDPNDITHFLAKKLEAYKLPRYIQQISEVPRFTNGKPDRKRAISQYSDLT